MGFELTTAKMNIWPDPTTEKGSFADDDLDCGSLPRSDVSARILTMTDITQDVGKLHVHDKVFSSVGDAGLEFGWLCILHRTYAMGHRSEHDK